jgi:hypothetical protein
MITRIRIEAEGATLEDVQRDLFAAHDRLVEHLSPGLTSTREHVYEEVDHADNPGYGRWFRGRFVFGFPVDTAHAVDADRLMGVAAPPEEGTVPGYQRETDSRSPDERVSDQLAAMGGDDVTAHDVR